ncbi:hypothetical protein GCM10009838_47950 [Catenulispora subtropica]|uniref:Uncharacterized protein n=1 Tax=Catenulispora subtropica TaxID=450798 RepID=A0ABN2S6L4_9ACTN
MSWSARGSTSPSRRATSPTADFAAGRAAGRDGVRDADADADVGVDVGIGRAAGRARAAEADMADSSMVLAMTRS